MNEEFDPTWTDHTPPREPAAPGPLATPGAGAFPSGPAQAPLLVEHPRAPGWDPVRGFQDEQDVLVMKAVKRPRPKQGWRAALANTTGIVLGKSAAELEHDSFVELINKPLSRNVSVPVVSLKGGVGKSTTTTGIGSTIAAHRDDGLVAGLDGVRYGTLATRAAKQSPSNVQRLLADPHLDSPNRISVHMSANRHRFYTLASDQPADLLPPLGPEGYRRALAALQTRHRIVLTDMSPDQSSSTWEAAIGSADALVLVLSPFANAARKAIEFVGLLRAIGRSDLVPRTTAVINCTTSAAEKFEMANVVQALHSNEIEVVRIPYDDHLAEDSTVELELVSKNVRAQYVKAAALVVRSLPAM